MASNVGRIAGLDRAKLRDLACAAFELGLARLRLNSPASRWLIAASSTEPDMLERDQAALVDRVAFAIPRVAMSLPWRADCLIQALAAKRWLARYGIATTLTLGVRRDRQVIFEAHAWLKAGEKLVTGGDISGYVPFG